MRHPLRIVVQVFVHRNNTKKNITNININTNRCNRRRDWVYRQCLRVHSRNKVNEYNKDYVD